MSFEDDFPSLTKDEDYFLHCIEDVENIIQKHCLDKKKVKDFIAFMRTLATCDEATIKIFEKGLDLTTN